MARRLPPLRALQAFEAAARTGSFSKAAQELNVTPAAISLQVKALEDYIAAELFVRKPQRLDLTRHGQVYLEALTSAFEIIDGATRRVMPARKRSILSIVVPPAVSMAWLIPRLPDFARHSPQVELRITSTTRLVDPASGGDYDAVIRFGRGGWSGFDADLLFLEKLVPVCSPAYLARAKTDHLPERLFRDTILTALSKPSDWDDWLDRFAPEVTPGENLRFCDCALTMQAAASGMGIALCDWAVAAPEIVAGRLVVLSPEFSLSRGTGHFLVYPDPLEPNVALVRDWLLDQTGAPSRER